ncbi:GtrA family protein [Furfurilactobacillus sp. WILCCON 0119]
MNNESSEAQRYALWGAVTVTFNVLLFYFLDKKLGIEYQLANLIDWVVSVFFAFVVNKYLVFKTHATGWWPEIGSFYLTRVLTYVIEVIFLWLLISQLTVNATVSKLIAHAIAIVVNYFLSKALVFKTASNHIDQQQPINKN